MSFSKTCLTFAIVPLGKQEGLGKIPIILPLQGAKLLIFSNNEKYGNELLRKKRRNMKNTKNKLPHMTVTVNATDRDTINQLSRELDIPQRRVVALLIETYTYRNAHDPPDQTVKAIQQSRDLILKRIDSLIAILRDQEKNLLRPTLISSQHNYSLQKTGINEILTTLYQLI